MKLFSGHSARSIAIAISILLAAVFFFYIFCIVPHISSYGQDASEPAENRKFHVLVVGTAENESVLQQIYAGAQGMSRKYDSVVEYHVPVSKADDVTLQSLLEYASFTNPDGIIAYIGEQESAVELPVNIKGYKIPLVTVVQYHPDIPQVSFIGTNYSELGRKIAVESNAYLNGRGSLVIINTSNSNNPNYSTLMNSLINTLGEYSSIRTSISDLSPAEEPSGLESDVRTEIVSDNINLIVCLTTEDTIHAAQAISDMNRGGRTGIIGFGEGSMAEMYLEKGIITELISIDSHKIGETAMTELFEYIRYGYANSYITADVRVRKGGDK